MDRTQLRAARRADASGSGPTLTEHAPARFPGAKGVFALFGEVLWTGLLIAVAGLAIVTLPAALAAGIRHLRRYVNAEESHARTFWHDWHRALLPGGLVVGAIAVGGAIVLAVDIVVAQSGALPGGQAVALIGWVALVIGGTVLLVTASAWTPEAGWRRAARGVVRTTGSDPVGTIYLAVAVMLLGVLTWMLIPLAVAGLGCAALAAVAVPARQRRRTLP